MYLILYQGNNYYNRKIIRHESMQDYINAGFKEVAAVPATSFIFNDGITTTHIVNADPEVNGYPDYAILYDDDDSINSRWWVTETVITRNGQYRVSLLRDVIADWKYEVISAPSFIKKGIITSINNTAIFNNEAMKFNQIKQKELFVKDKTESGWYVGFLSKDFTSKIINVPGRPTNPSATYASLSEYPYHSYTESYPFLGDYTDVTFVLRCYIYARMNWKYGWDADGQPKTPQGIETNGVFEWDPGGHPTGSISQYNPDNTKGFLISGGISEPQAVYNEVVKNTNWKTMSYSLTTAHDLDTTTTFINQENGRIVKIGGALKKIVIKSKSINNVIAIPNSSTFSQKLQEVAQQVFWLDPSWDNVNGNVGEIQFSVPAYFVTYEDVAEESFSYTIPENRTHTAAVPYDIFAIPAGPIGLIGDLHPPTESNPEFSQELVAAITNQLVTGDSAELYDIQYVPYCPISDDFLIPYFIDTNKLTNDENAINYSYLRFTEEGEINWTIVIYASSASFSKIVNSPVIRVPENALDFKVANECDMYRLCSPNYNGQFEFSATKNGGITGWNIVFTYKPYTPYIKVSPIFGRLYGKDFNDARGLICGGDFSLPQTNSQWASYELQNKNYQVMFDRQISNMETNNAIQRELEVVSAITGTLTGGVTGGIAGGMAGPYGAAVGAAAGTILSGIAGYKDIQLNDKLRAEALDYAKDQYGYNLQNIQALPYSLTKVGSQNTDYKIWPFVEHYSASDDEREALKNKLIWNGYTIERIGNISSYLAPDTENFIQGKIIRLDSINADSHVANVINAELQTGVYFV